ncbi:MAG: hypothetical protein QM723_34305 [Myxococcaceae bacterium]
MGAAEPIWWQAWVMFAVQKDLSQVLDDGTLLRASFAAAYSDISPRDLVRIAEGPGAKPFQRWRAAAVVQ